MLFAGTVNQVCHTVQGIDDVITATIHIILGELESEKSFPSLGNLNVA